MDGGNIGCYYVAKTASSMSYFGAQKYCKSLDRRAHLVEVRSKDIQTFIESLKDFHYFFLGGSDRSKVCILVTTRDPRNPKTRSLKMKPDKPEPELL